KVLPICCRQSRNKCSRRSSSSSGKQWARLIRATSLERLGSFHISQPISAPRRCTIDQGSRANSLRNPTISAPLNLSKAYSRRKSKWLVYPHRQVRRRRSGQRRMPMAVGGVIHDQSAGLHVGVTDGRADEAETGLFQGSTHGLGLWCDSRHMLMRREVIDQRL